MPSMLPRLLAAECPTSLVRQLRTRARSAMPDRLWKALADAGVFGLSHREELRRLRRHAIRPRRLLRRGRTGVVPHGRAQHRCRRRWPSTCSADRTSMPRGCPRWPPEGSRHDRVVERRAMRADRRRCGLRAAADGRLAAQRRGRLRRRRRPGRHHRRHRRRRGVGRTMGFVVDAARDGRARRTMPMMGGHRAFAVRFDDVRWRIERGAAGPTARIDRARLRRVANAAVALTVAGPGRRRRGGAAAHRRLHEDAPTVRPADRVVSGGAASGRRTCTSRWPRLGSRRTRRCSGSGGVAPRPARPRSPECTRPAQVKQITLDAHQLHGGMGYVVETDLHLFSERARVLSTLGGGADIAASMA